MNIYTISKDLNLIDLMPPVPGFEEFLGSYVLRGEEVAMVDVGPSNCASTLLQGLATLNISPKEVEYLFITHIHIDHAGGLGTLMEHMPQAKVIVHEKGIRHLIDPQRLWEASKQALGELAEKYGEIFPVPQERIIVAEEGMQIDLGRGINVEVLATPGHAPHHLSFLERKDKVLFAGEAAGILAKGTLRPGTPPPFNLEQALASLDKLIAATPSALCYGHFGCVDDAPRRLQAHRDQLVLWGKVVADGMAKETSMEQMSQELMERDKLLQGLDNLSGEQQQREHFFISNSIWGFLDYFRKHGVPNDLASDPE